MDPTRPPEPFLSPQTSLRTEGGISLIGKTIMPVKQNHSGRIYGRITLSAPVPGKPGYWQGTCSCGNPVEKRIDNLKRPGVHSCGKCYPINPSERKRVIIFVRPSMTFMTLHLNSRRPT